jgi:hypothetical protein
MADWDQSTTAAVLPVLPATLKGLSLWHFECEELPACLVRLSGLEQLTIGSSTLRELPEWLPQLQRLQRLSYRSSALGAASPGVLGRVPLLRNVSLLDEAPPAVVLADAPHLLWSWR